MVLVDEEGNRYNTDKLDILSSIGKSALVYKLGDDKVLKVTRDIKYINDNYIRITEELRNGGYSCFAKIISLVNDEQNVYGNLAVRYTHHNNLLYLRIDDLLAAITKLEEEINRLTKKKIAFWDITSSLNCFIYKGRFLVIDYWGLYFSKEMSMSELEKSNNFFLNQLIINLLLEKCNSQTLLQYLLTINSKIDKSRPICQQYEKHLSKIDTSFHTHFR